MPKSTKRAIRTDGPSLNSLKASLLNIYLCGNGIINGSYVCVHNTESPIKFNQFFYSYSNSRIVDGNKKMYDIIRF